MTHKEQIIEVLKKHIGECAISGDDADYLLFHLTKDILSLPIDVPSDEELEPYFTYKKPYIEDKDEGSKTYFAFSDDKLYAVKLFWRWMRNEILKRNGKDNS